MGREPLELTVDGWKLIVDMNDHRLQLQIVTENQVSRYVRLTPTQAGVLRDYLRVTVPVTQ